MEEDSLPGSVRQVRGTVYSADTPLQVCRFVAGAHQATQHNVKESTMADISEMVMQLMQERKQKTGKAMMSDEEIYQSISHLWSGQGQ